MNFIDLIEQHYSDFEITNKRIPISWFHKDFKDALLKTFRNRQNVYDKLCLERNKNPNELDMIYIEKDDKGNCYLNIFGNDGSSMICIKKDYSNLYYYKQFKGFKITAEEFLTNNNIIDINEQTNNIIKYVNYLKNEYQNNLDEQNNYVCLTKDSYKTSKCENHIYIDFNLRENVLLSYEPLKKITYTDSFNKEEIYAYLYKKNNNFIAVIEPLNGLYTKVLCFDDDIDIEHTIKEAIEEDKTDSASIIRFGYVDIDTYKYNLSLLLKPKRFIRGKNYQL